MLVLTPHFLSPSAHGLATRLIITLSVLSTLPTLPDRTHLTTLCAPLPSLLARYLFADASKVIEYVQLAWPYWNQTKGGRHMLLSTSKPMDDE